MDAWEEVLFSQISDAQKELYLKCKTVGQPYLDRMNATTNMEEIVRLHAEVTEKINAITWEYTLRQDAMK